MANLMQRMFQRLAGLTPGATSGTAVAPAAVPTAPTPRRAGVAVQMRGESPGDYQHTGTEVRFRGFERHPVVQAGVRLVADLIAAVPFEAYVKKAGDIEVVPEHEASALLESPSTFLSGVRLRQFLGAHLMVYGNAMWQLARASERAKPGEIRVIQPEDVHAVWVEQRGYPLYYQFADAAGNRQVAPVVDIMHFRDLNAKGLVFGYPRIAAALQDIVSDTEGTQFVRQVLTNDGSAGAVFIVDDEVTDEKDARVLEERYYEKMAVRGGRGRTVFMGGIKSIQQMGFNLQQLEFPDMRRVTREDICAAIGVDPRMIGIASATKDGGLSGDQYREARVRLIQQTCEPLMRAIESELNLWYAPEFGDCYIRFSPEHLQALVEDDDATSTRVREEVKANLMTIEEGRKALGREAKYAAGDTLSIGLGTQLVPVELALFDPTLPSKGGPGGLDDDGGDGGGSGGAAAGGAGADDDGDGAGEGGAAEAEAAGRAARRLLGSTGNLLTRGVKLTPEQRVLLWKDFDTRASREEGAYRRQALILFAEERASVTRVFEHAIAQAEQASRATGKPNPMDAEKTYVQAARRELRKMYRDDGEVEQRWADRYEPLVRGTYNAGGVAMAAKASRARNTQVRFDANQAAVQAAIVARAKRLAHYVGRTTGEHIMDAIAIGLRDGMNIRQIAKLVDATTFGIGASSRATMIARTETIGALNQGEFDEATRTGTVAKKEWLSQGDGRVRDTHLYCEAEGQIPLADRFAPTGMLHPGDQAGDPGDVINCRCTLLYYDE